MGNRFSALLALFMMRGTLPRRLKVPAFVLASLLLIVMLAVSVSALWEAPVTADTIALTTLFVLVAVFVLNAAKEPDPKKGQAAKRYIEQQTKEKDDADKR